MSAPALAALGRTSLSAGVMILAVLALRTRFRDRTPYRAFCLLWDLCLLRLLLVMDIPSPFSVQRLLENLVPRRESGVTAMFQGPLTQVTLMEDHLVQGDMVQEFPLAAGTAQTLSINWPGLVALLWLAGTALCGAWLLWGHLRSRRIYAASLPVRSAAVEDWQARHPLRRPVQVRCSDRIVSPLTYGILYPVVLLPTGLDLGETLSCVLAHEYTHIRRFDALRKGLLALALSLHWFNPLVWVMYVLANRDIELSCDEAVVRSGADRRNYALALLRLEEERGFLSGSAFSRSALQERIEAIMKIKKVSLTALIAILLVMSIATTVFAASAPEEESSTRLGTTATYTETLKEGIVSRQDQEGNTIYSADGGKSWMSEDRYRAEYQGDWGDGWIVEWWTAEDYAAWLEQEKQALQEIIGERAYTGGDGWFVWDQKKVDETIAMYEQTLEDIRNGALVSKSIRDKDGNPVDDVFLGSGGYVCSAGELDDVATAFRADDIGALEREALIRKDLNVDALLAECAPFGLTGSEKDGLFYNGQPVRYFVDGASVGESGCYGIRYTYIDETGTVDVHTLRSVIYNADGSYDPISGDLIGLAGKGDANFDQDLIACAKPSLGEQTALADLAGSGWLFSTTDKQLAGAEATDAQGYRNSQGGRTFEEIFAQYAAYGLTCEPGVNSFVNLTYGGMTVRRFADLRPDGGAFTYENPYAEEGISVQTVYDENGVLTGLTTEGNQA